MIKHGLSRKHPLYRVWLNMRNRCNNPNYHAYHRYGGRGITVCPEWDCFKTFLRDVGDRPGPGYELDRKDNDKGYSKDNCRWVLHDTNMRNKGMYSSNNTGVKGVAPHNKGRYWRSYYCEGGKNKTLYIGKDFFEAVAARKSWEQSHYEG